MKAEELRSKSADELSDELLKLRKEQFNLRMQKATGQLANQNDFRIVRRSIARIKTILTEKASAGGES